MEAGILATRAPLCNRSGADGPRQAAALRIPPRIGPLAPSAGIPPAPPRPARAKRTGIKLPIIIIAIGMYIPAMKQDSPPTDFEYHLGYWLRLVSNHVSHAFRDRIAKFEMTVAEWVALRSLHNRAPCTLKQLAEQIGIDAGATSRLAERLFRKGLASRQEGAPDRRAIILDLTAEGRSLVRKIGKEADLNDEAFFGHLPRSGRDALMHILQGLVATHHLTEKPIT